MDRQTINTTEIHKLTGLDRTTIAKHLAHITPMTIPGAKNASNYYLDEVLGVLVRSFKAKSEDGPKARRELADAEKAEILVAKLKGELAPTALMRSTAADLVKSLFQRCVMLAPRILSDKITGNPDRTEIEITIREYFAAIFDELRSLPNNFLNMPVEDDVVSPTAD